MVRLPYVEFESRVRPMATSIKEHSGDGLPDSVVGSLWALKHQPALAWAALTLGLVFFFELHLRTRYLEHPQYGLTGMRDEKWYNLWVLRGGPDDLELDKLPASVVDSLHRLWEDSDVQNFAIPNVYRQVLEACRDMDDVEEAIPFSRDYEEDEDEDLW
eukprot:gene18197-24639_t